MEKLSFPWRECDHVYEPHSDNKGIINKEIEFSKVIQPKGAAVTFDFDGKKLLIIKPNGNGNSVEFSVIAEGNYSTSSVYLISLYLKAKNGTHICADEFWLMNRTRGLISFTWGIHKSYLEENYVVAKKFKVVLVMVKVSVSKDYKLLCAPEDVDRLMNAHDKEIRNTLRYLIGSTKRACENLSDGFGETMSKWLHERMEKTSSEIKVSINKFYVKAVMEILGVAEKPGIAKGLTGEEDDKGKGKGKKGGGRRNKGKKGDGVKTFKSVDYNTKLGAVNLKCILVIQSLLQCLEDKGFNVHENTVDITDEKFWVFKKNIADEVRQIVEGKIEGGQFDTAAKGLSFVLLHIYALVVSFTDLLPDLVDAAMESLEFDEEKRETKKEKKSANQEGPEEVITKEEGEEEESEERENIDVGGTTNLPREEEEEGNNKSLITYDIDSSVKSDDGFQMVKNKKKEKKMIGWLMKHKDPNVFVINSDASTRTKIKKGGLGIIVRRSKGNLLYACSDVIDDSSGCDMYLELIGIKQGLEKARDLGHKNYLLITDCLYGHIAMKKPTIESRTAFLSTKAAEAKKETDIRVEHIPMILNVIAEIDNLTHELVRNGVVLNFMFREREGNFVADALSKKYVKREYTDEYEFDADLKKWYDADMAGWKYKRGYGKNN